jgi:hypothetical protein
VAGELERLAYESSLRALDKQEQLLAELRARTGLLLAASSLAASFLGRPALESAQPVLLAAALAAFGVSVGASIYVLLPRRDLVFSVAGPALFESLFEFEDAMNEVHRRLTYDLHRFWTSNDAVVARLARVYWIAGVALAVEVILLLISVSDTLF